MSAPSEDVVSRVRYTNSDDDDIYRPVSDDTYWTPTPSELVDAEAAHIAEVHA